MYTIPVQKMQKHTKATFVTKSLTSSDLKKIIIIITKITTSGFTSRIMGELFHLAVSVGYKRKG